MKWVIIQFVASKQRLNNRTQTLYSRKSCCSMLATLTFLVDRRATALRLRTIRTSLSVNERSKNLFSYEIKEAAYMWNISKW